MLRAEFFAWTKRQSAFWVDFGLFSWNWIEIWFIERNIRPHWWEVLENNLIYIMFWSMPSSKLEEMAGSINNCESGLGFLKDCNIPLKINKQPSSRAYIQMKTHFSTSFNNTLIYYLITQETSFPSENLKLSFHFIYLFFFGLLL